MYSGYTALRYCDVFSDLLCQVSLVKLVRYITDRQYCETAGDLFIIYRHSFEVCGAGIFNSGLIYGGGVFICQEFWVRLQSDNSRLTLRTFNHPLFLLSFVLLLRKFIQTFRSVTFRSSPYP